MDYYGHFITVQLIFALVFVIYTSSSHCTNGLCEKISLSLATDSKYNTTLVGYVFERLSVASWQQCSHTCVANCQCLSFNFNRVNTTENCELNDAYSKLTPGALDGKEGVNYYEPVRNYFDKNGVSQQTCSDPICQTHCCDSAPCQNGGTCHNICHVNKRRFHCDCPRVFIGHRCQYPLIPRSCQDIRILNKTSSNGIFSIVDQFNNSFPVYCDFHSESGFAWTLIQSHSLQNKGLFNGKAFYMHDFPTNVDTPGWNSYRLAKSRMQSIRDVSSHWRATCNFLTDKIDFRDYIRTTFAKNDLLAVPDVNFRCAWYELVNIRGNRCEDCTAYSPYGPKYGYHIDSWWQPQECEFDGRPGGIDDEDNFGEYGHVNSAFRCSSSSTSTTEFWIGGP
ncbi:uncharacterized protein LOC111330812 [Stylophora pistillata]|uniref:uncharacterized protein LOC111330812 n=1 Tax=Stylophora pistillata TaxID=50429 RepID=UPI000C049F69|nr:uncharacterized protein LOC111330812 [Stylophora pistillata]